MDQLSAVVEDEVAQSPGSLQSEPTVRIAGIGEGYPEENGRIKGCAVPYEGMWLQKILT
jgi:hypothetical protein